MEKPRKPGHRPDESRTYPSARSGVEQARRHKSETPQTSSTAYELAYSDDDFLCREELRPVRLQLELLKPEVLLQEEEVDSTFVIFGSSRINESDAAAKNLQAAEAELAKSPADHELLRNVKIARRMCENARYYDEARKLARRISSCRKNGEHNYLYVVTGGGPGIMEAANRGAHDVGSKSIGLNIVLPDEQGPNHYITPELCFQFHYFALRKMHFLMRAKALCVFPGGFGTLDELFETMTLIQTGKIAPMPLLLFGEKFWSNVINFETLIEEGTISPGDINLFQYVETADEAWEIVRDFFDLPGDTAESPRQTG